MSATLTNSDIRQDIQRVFQLQQSNTGKMARTTAKERSERLSRIDNYLRDEQNLAALCRAMYDDFKKPEVEVIATETGVVHTHTSHIKRRLRQWVRPQRVATPLPMAGTQSYIHYEPKGVCLIIAPWNYPLNLALVPLAYAIAAGNTVILKPSEISANTSAFIKKMISELFDESEVAVFEGDASVAQALLEQPFNHIFFTGSPQIGKVIMGAAAKHLASVTLELGGKSPAIVDRSANVPVIAERAAWGKLINNGQTCIAPDYLLLEETIRDKFIAAFGKTVEKFYNPKGEDIKNSPDYSRVINRRHYQRLKRLYDDALEKGAEVISGGEFDESENFIAPTLLGNVTEDMAIMQEEIFGPLLPVLTYRSNEEAVAIIRRRPKPLTLYIASKNKQNIDHFMRETSAGGTVINDYLLGYANPNVPFGGVNNSGIGKSLGFHGFVEFSNERGVIHRKWGTLSFIFPPYNERIRKLVQLIYRWI